MPSIRDFSGGVVNQELLGKDGGTGIMIDANNVLSSWNGELRKRTGSRIIAQLEKKSRIIPYRLPKNDDALLLFTDKRVQGFEIDDSGLIPMQISTDNELHFPGAGWTSNTNGDWSVKTNMQVHKDFIDAPFRMFNFDESRIDTWYAPLRKSGAYIQITNSANSFVLKQWKLNFYHGVAGNYTYFDSPTLQYSDDNSTWHNVETLHTKSFSSSSKFKIVSFSIANKSGEAESHKYWRVFFATSTGGDGCFIYSKSISVSSSSAESLDYVTDFSEPVLESIKFGQASDNIYFAASKSKPFAIQKQAGVVNGGVFVPTKTSGIWDNEGYPACVAAFQNRLAFAGFDKHKTRVVLSEFGEFNNFTVKTSDVKSTDPISADSVELRAQIENLWAGNNALYALSSDGVSMLDAQGGVVATDQINFKLRNREPADGMTPTTKDDIMVYLGNGRRKIFITDYDFVVQRFKAKDLAIGYNGFLTSRIVALHYASRKCSLIYGYKDDGNMLALLFDIDMQKNALFPCDIGGDIKDMQVFKSGDKFRVLMVTQIEDRWYLVEKNEQPEYAAMDFMTKDEKVAYTEAVMQNGMYLDYMTRRYFNTPVDMIDDVPYGIGEQVAVFADGKYIGEKICSAGGPYAWVDGTDLVYTKKVLPETGDLLYDKDDQIIEDKKLVSVDGKKITVEVRGEDKVEVVDFYGWSCEKSITGPTLGKLERNPERDSTYNNNYRFGWGNYYTSQPAVADEPAIMAEPWDYIEKANAVERIILYTLNPNPQVGDDVYDENFAIVGKIEEMGATNTLFVSKPTVLTYVVFNGDKYYRNGRINTKHETAVPTYESHEYSRSVIDDLVTGPVGIRLDEPAKDFILGYNYDAYAVLKLATPYTSKKYPKEVATYLINTGYLEIGNSFDNLQPILNNMRDKLDLFDKPVLLNGEYTKTMDKLDNSPYIILRSNEPMPFMITGIDFKVDYSNYQGGI